MNFLPDELLLQIFKYVPSRDRRRSVRRVCRQWRRIAEDRVFVKRERICVNYHLDFENIFSNLQLSSRSSFSLSFVCREFREAELEHPFWRDCGSRVHSLVFDLCLLTFANFETLVSSCPFVEHVSLLCDTTGLDRLLENFPLHTFTAPSVSSFSLHINSKSQRELSYEIMYKILATFPNLQELKLSIHNSHNYQKLVTQSGGENALDHGPLLPIEKAPIMAIAHYIQTRNKLKKLWLMQPVSDSHQSEQIVDFAGVLSELKGLQELTIVGPQFLNFDILSPEKLLLKLSNVTVFSLSHIPHFDVQTALNSILDSISHLRVLQLESSSVIIYDESLINKLLTSKLKKLHLSCDHCVFYEDNGRLPVNGSLEELVIFDQIRSFGEVNPLFALISPYLKNLRYLALSHPGDTTLQSIFKHQEGLKSLVLDTSEACSDFGFSGRNPDNGQILGYSIKKLKELEYLCMKSVNLHITSTASLSLVLPKLKSLKMHIFPNDCGMKQKQPFVTQLLTALKENAFLECIQLRVPTVDDLPWKKLKKFLRSMKELRYFSLTFNVPCNQKLLQPTYDRMYELFDVCPTLRFILHDKKSFFQQRSSVHGLEILDITGYPAVFPEPKEILPKWSYWSDNEPDSVSGLDNLRFD